MIRGASITETDKIPGHADNGTISYSKGIQTVKQFPCKLVFGNITFSKIPFTCSMEGATKDTVNAYLYIEKKRNDNYGVIQSVTW